MQNTTLQNYFYITSLTLHKCDDSSQNVKFNTQMLLKHIKNNIINMQLYPLFINEITL